MATRFELVLEGADRSRLRAIAEEVFDEIRFREAAWSRFAKDSVISRVNREAFERSVILDGETWSLLEEALRIRAQSAGWFDPTLADLMDEFDAMASVLAHVHAAGDDVRLDAASRSVRFERSGVRLDLGGIAKGRALDLAAELLVDHGVERALLHGGTSSVVALGAPEGLDGWRIALSEDPNAPVAVLRDCALSVSGTHGRTNAAGGHVLDPHARRPARSESSAAVIARSASIADAWSTALCAAGELELELPDDVHAALQHFDADADSSWRWRTSPSDCIRFSPEPAEGAALRA